MIWNMSLPSIIGDKTMHPSSLFFSIAPLINLNKEEMLREDQNAAIAENPLKSDWRARETNGFSLSQYRSGICSQIGFSSWCDH